MGSKGEGFGNVEQGGFGDREYGGGVGDGEQGGRVWICGARSKGLKVGSKGEGFGDVEQGVRVWRWAARGKGWGWEYN